MNLLKADGYIYIDWPFLGSSSHYLTNPSCAGTANLKSTLSCSYNTGSRRLTIGPGIATSDTAGGSSFSFTISNVNNPYTTFPTEGFEIYTADIEGGLIDYAEFTFEVSEATSFSYAYVSPSNDPGIVEEQNHLVFTFKLPIPISGNCIMEIVFPDSMPVTSDVTTTLSGTGIFNSATSNSIDIANNKVYVNGCTAKTSWSAVNAIGSLTLTSPLNQAYVANTQTFQLILYFVSGSNFKIAEKVSGITLSADKFTTGLITSFAVNPSILYV